MTQHMYTHYQRIAADLRTRILAGNLPPGSRLPSEKELAEQWDVSIPTIRQAVYNLQSEGLVRKRRGIGTFVRETQARVTYGEPCLFDGRAELTPLRARISRREVPADESAASLLRVPEGAGITEYVYVTRCEGVPYAVVHVYVPLGVADEVAAPEASSPLGCDIRKRLVDAGLPLGTTERVTARAPSVAEAQTLEITTRTPVLVVERTTTTPENRVVEAASVVLPGDRADVVFSRGSEGRQLEGAR